MAPQIFQVLRCYKCSVFQTHQVKKSNKWKCKMCGEKQSRKRNYGVGSGKDCRLQVQKLNVIRGEINDVDIAEVDDDIEDTIEEKAGVSSNGASKWSNYIEDDASMTTDHRADMYYNGSKVVLERPKKEIMRTAKRNKNKEKCYDNVDSITVKDDQLMIDHNLPKKKLKFVAPVKVPSITDTDNEKKVLYLGFSPPEKAFIVEQDNLIQDVKEITTGSCFENKLLSSSKRDKGVKKVANSSKWAQFIEDVELNLENDQNGKEDCESNSSISNAKNIKSQDIHEMHEIFSLGDEPDLDAILSF